MNSTLDPKRTVAELKELRALTGDENGAQRVAFTPTWSAARQWLREKLAALPVEVHTDEAGNLWSTLRGASERALLIGGHLDSVPNGGWLDGCLNVLAGVEILRRIAARVRRANHPITVRLVDWADEEGARASGKVSSARRRARAISTWTEARVVCAIGTASALPDALREHGIDLDAAKNSGRELARTPPLTWSCTSSKVPSCSIWICRWARSSAPSASSATR